MATLKTIPADTPTSTVPILIIGSSLIGLTLSTLLPHHNVNGCLTIEKHLGTAIHPRAALFHPRTLQIYRELGLYDAMREKSLEQYDEHAGLWAIESLAGKVLGHWMKDVSQGLEGISTVGRLFLTQQSFEPVLRERARERGARVEFGKELVDFEQDAAGVRALVKDVKIGKLQVVRAKYMVACDGSKSAVRRKLGIKMLGHGLLSHSLTIYFRADLRNFVEGRYNGVMYVNNEDLRGFFRMNKTGQEGFLVVNNFGKKGTEESRHPSVGVTKEKAGEMLLSAIGAEVPFEITALAPWEARCEVAEQFNVGRILLAGDSAHNNVPNGGFGGNTGVQDAHNLAWKLALVLQGKAGEELVTQTYHDERYPVVKKTIDQVFERYIVRTAPDLRTDDMELEEEVPEPHLELGYRYHSKALMTSGLGSVNEDPRSAEARPGSLAHHVLIQTTTGKELVPMAELLGSNFVLIAGHQGSSWTKATQDMLRKERDLPELTAHQLTKDNDTFYEKYDITPTGCVLIRPDGFVAWSRRSVQDAKITVVPVLARQLQNVMRRILCLDGTGEPAISATARTSKL